MCGDFNSKPDSSPIHYVMNKQYSISDERKDLKAGVLSYRDSGGIEKFQAVEAIMHKNTHKLSNVTGKFDSAYALYNDLPLLEEPKHNTSASLLQWANNFK